MCVNWLLRIRDEDDSALANPLNNSITVSPASTGARRLILRRVLVVGAMIVVLLTGTWTAIAQTKRDFSLIWYSVDGGGGTSTGDEFSLRGSAGQADAGLAVGGPFSLSGGVMAGAVPGFVAGVCGDQNDDGAVDLLDLIIGLQILVGLIDPTETQLRLGDLTRDGEIGVDDSIMALRHLVGAIVLSGCGFSASATGS